MARRIRLNPQGLARRSKELMATMVADSGETFVSIDLASGEPSVTSQMSKDENYIYACFGGIGKEPYYRDGLLMCDDIYVMNMSKSPLHGHLVREAFDTRKFDGLTFAQQWVIDKEVITKGVLKKAREIEKPMALGLGYGMQPKKLVSHSYERGFSITLPQAKQFYDSYWGTFSRVRKFADYCALLIKKNGYLVNPFGYRLKCSPRLGYNYMIQSSVSGIIHVLTMKLFTIAPYARLVTIIHDELVCRVPTEMIDKFKRDLDTATASLNEDLGWLIPIRTGFAPGQSLYEAK